MTLNVPKSANAVESLLLLLRAMVLTVGLFLAHPPRSQAASPTLWDCGGEGERPCPCTADFFWENGNLFADRGLVATGFRVLGPVKFNTTEWVNLNRADLTLAVDLINVQLPALQKRVGGLSTDDFLKKQCIGTLVNGTCWLTPPTVQLVYGTEILGVCTPWPKSSDCDHYVEIPGVPSTSFDYFPDFSKSGWSVASDITTFLGQVTKVMAQFPPAVRGIPGTVPSLNFKIPNSGNPVDLASFQNSITALNGFFADNAGFFGNFRDLILDFSSPPPTAVCVNATRRQAEPAAFQSTWAWWAFRHQRELAKDEPLNWSARISTHNAFNNEADGYIAPNQKWSITDQLNLGSRHLMLDIHWFDSGAGKLRLSHATPEHQGASGVDRYYANAIKEIGRWLRDNPTEVISISFEDRSDKAPDSVVTDPLEVYLGDLVYRRTEGNNPWRNGGYDPLGQWPSLQELRDLGKRVLIDGGKDHKSNLIWTGLPGPVGDLGAEKAKNFTPDFASLVARSDGSVIGPFSDTKIGVQYESRSWLDAFELAGYLTVQGLIDRRPYNISVTALDMLHAQQYTSQCPSAGPDVCDAPDERIAAMVWSWKPGQPEDITGGVDNGEDAAMVDATTGRWESRNPSEVHYFAACRKRGLAPLDLPDRAGVDWKITELAGAWSDGEAAVADLNQRLRSNSVDDDCDGQVDESDEGNYVFGAPANGAQNERLRRAMEDFRVRHNLAQLDVWIACHDRITPGQWILSRSFPADDLAQHASSLSFDGVNQSVVVETHGSLIPRNEITIEFWQKTAEPRQQVTLSVTEGIISNRLGIHSPWVDGNVYWDFGDISESGEGRLAYRPPVDITGTWQHFAMVASQSGNYMKIFRNGVEEAAKTGMSGYDSLPVTSAPMYIGAGSQGPHSFFKGQLDELRIWNVARTASQIRSTLFRRVGAGEPGLVAHWKLDEEPGAAVTDSVNEFNGERLNGPEWITLKPAAAEAWSSYLTSLSPLVHHRLDESAACSVATDQSGHGLHGTYAGAVASQPSRPPFPGHSAGLPSKGGGGVALHDLGLLDQFTLSLWIKPINLSSNIQVLGGSDATGSPNITLLAGGHLQVSVRGNVPSSIIVSNAIPEPGIWRLLTMVYDSTLSPGSLKLLLDGTSVADIPMPTHQKAAFNGLFLGSRATASGTASFVIRGAGGSLGTATLGGVTFDSLPGNVDLGGGVVVTPVGAQVDLGSEWRTPLVPKPLDVDGNHLLGTDGYYVVNAEPELPSYVSKASILTSIYPGNGAYASIDDPTRALPVFLTGTMNPAPGSGLLADLFSFTLNPGASGRTIRVGLLVDNLDIAGFNAASLSIVPTFPTNGPPAAIATSDPGFNNGVPDWLFFDIAGVGSPVAVELDDFVLFPKAFSDPELQALQQHAPDGMFLSITPVPGQQNVVSNLVQVVHLEGSVEWDVSRVELRLDGAVVPAGVERQGGVLVVSYQPPQPFPSGSAHLAELAYPVSAGGVRTLAWQFNSERYSLDVVQGRRGALTGEAVFTPDAGGRSGGSGDYAIEFGTTQTGQSIRIRDAAFLNLAAAGDEMAVTGWQKLHSIAASAFFWGISPSSNEGSRGWSTHAPWPDGNVIFDTAGCCDETRRLSASIFDFPPYWAVDDPIYWNSWHHFVFQKRGATKEIWIDGQLLVKAAGAAPLPADFTEAFIGYNPVRGESVQGAFDDVAVFKSLLQPTDIAALASGAPATSLPPASGLLAFWNFDDAAPVTPLRIERVAVAGGNFRLSWSGGPGPFTVSRKQSLSDPAWTPIASTQSLSVEVPVGAGSGFFKVTEE